MNLQPCPKTLIAWLYSAALLSAAEPAVPGNLLPTGNFEPAKEGELVQGWELPPKDWQAQKGFTAAIVEEKDAAGTANHRLGFTSSAPELTVTASTTVALPPGTRGVRLAGRFRVEKITVDTKQNWTGAFIGGSVLDAAKKKIGGIPTGFRFREATGGWVKKEAVLKLPEGAAFLLLQPGIFLASGDFGVDDLEVSVAALPAGTPQSAPKTETQGPPSTATMLALDFNGDAAALPAIEAFSSASAVKVTQAFANEGTIDTFRGQRSGATVLTVNASAAKDAWSAGVRTPLLAVENAETALAKLTLSFDLQASQPRPVRVRVASFDPQRKQTGGLEKWVVPPVAGSFYRHSLDLSEMTTWKGKFDPAAPFIQLSWEIASDAPQPWAKGDGLVVRVDNVSFARPGYYVSASGSDKADGRTEATAFLTIKKAVAAAQAGDTVLVMDGVYPLGGGVSFEKSGTPAKWITLKRAPGAKPRLEFASWSGFAVKAGAAFVEINGIEIAGNAANVTLEEAQEDGRAAKPGAKFNGSAISIEGKTLEEGRTVKDETPHRDRADRPHHIRVIGCNVHDACGAGVAVMLADYVTIEGNTVSDCAARSRYAHSGITLYWAWNFDASTEHRNFVRSNVAARNRTMVAWLPPWEKDRSKARASDGNGIIIDDFIQHQPGAPGEPNVGRTLVQNNLAHHSGGGGVHVFSSDRVDLVNNTSFANSQTPEIDTGDIDTSWSRDCRVLNNIAVASPGKTVHRNRNRENKPEASNAWQGNVLFADGQKKVIDFSEHDTWADPLLIAPAPDAPPASFGLQPGSPARGAAIDGPLVSSLDLFGTPRPSAGKFDCGAIQSSAAKVKGPDAAKGDKPPAKKNLSR